MSNIPAAYPSPRVANGVIYWYDGDTFELTFDLELTDQDGETVDIAPADTVTVDFFDETMTRVKQFVFTDIQNNKIVLQFDSAASELFARGKYTYDVLYQYGERTTLASHNKAVVE